MIVDEKVALETASHEALIRQAYKDSGNKWTWSIGLTSATGHMVERYIGEPQPLEHCLAVYIWALDNYADQVRAVFADHPLTQAEFAAAVSFHWNTGAIKEASWVKFFKQGDFDNAEESFRSWNKVGGKISVGLASRRDKESELLFRGKWSNNGRVLEYTKLTDRSTPDFGSGKVIDVLPTLKRVMEKRETPSIDQPPKPDAPVNPTLTPDINLVYDNLFKLLLEWLIRLFRG